MKKKKAKEWVYRRRASDRAEMFDDLVAYVLGPGKVHHPREREHARSLVKAALLLLERKTQVRRAKINKTNRKNASKRKRPTLRDRYPQPEFAATALRASRAKWMEQHEGSAHGWYSDTRERLRRKNLPAPDDRVLKRLME